MSLINRLILKMIKQIIIMLFTDEERENLPGIKCRIHGHISLLYPDSLIFIRGGVTDSMPVIIMPDGGLIIS